MFHFFFFHFASHRSLRVLRGRRNGCSPHFHFRSEFQSFHTLSNNIQIASEDCVYGEDYFHPVFYVSHGEMATTLLSTAYRRFFGASFQPSERTEGLLSLKRVLKQISLRYRQSIWDEEVREALDCIDGYQLM